MKEVTITKYQCETCGTEFDSKEDAERCEGSHMSIERVEFLYNPNCKEPHAVRAFASDGQVFEYREGFYAGFAFAESGTE